MRTSARRDGEDYVLNGQKTWITNGPYADTIVIYASSTTAAARRCATARS